METLHYRHAIDVLPGTDAVTVRKGRKWSGARSGDDLALCWCREAPTFGEPEPEVEHFLVGYATVESVRLTYPRGILAWELALEAVPAARTYDGLIAGLESHYGEFSEYDEFVVMRYRRTV